MSGASSRATADGPGAKERLTRERPSISRSRTPKGKNMSRLGRILLVEDNLNDIELTTVALKQNHVINEIVVTRHGGEALDYLYRRGPYQDRERGNTIVVLLDLKMPKVDGLQVLRQ